MEKKNLALLSAAFVVLAVTLFAAVSSVSVTRQLVGNPDMPSVIPRALSPGKNSEKLSRFGSEEAFRTYLSESRESQMAGFEARSVMPIEMSAMSSDSAISSKKALVDGAGFSDTRISDTNVQVAGIDEPDIVKTDGSVIYFSREPDYRIFNTPVSMMEKRTAIETEISMIAPGEPMIAPNWSDSSGRTDVIVAVPPENMARLKSLGRSGEMLLFGETLVVFDVSRLDIAAYDVSDAEAPKERWSLRRSDGTELVAARKYESTLYLVEKTLVSESISCPIVPLSIGMKRISIPCADIYRPSVPATADAVFTVLSVDVETGEVQAKTSFVGSAGQTTVYMSENAIYVSYPRTGDLIRYMLGFFRENRELLPDGALERIERLSGYNIGHSAKMTELSEIISGFALGRDADDQLRFQNEMQNRMSEYAKMHLRELESTGIVKLKLSELSIAASGSVPGYLLNQFSFDEYQGSLRVATTVGGRGVFLFGWGGGRDASANDVYILDSNLSHEGELLDLGQGERIYSARFVGKIGYLVTFRETDPFYVLDLSDPKKPRKAGELKIPGYSSYLHPIEKDIILGIGKEDGRVKLSLFNVSSPNNPREISKYMLDEYWSEAVQNHHAFLADPKHGVFFLPGGQGGYIFSYEGNKLSLVKAAKDDRIKRALFIGNTFYIVSEDAVYAFDENTWEKVRELVL